jgi:hypothetical protein
VICDYFFSLNGDIIDGKRQGWKLLEVMFPIEFYELTPRLHPGL